MTHSHADLPPSEPTPRQAEILARALELVEQHGLANLTLKRVAERVGFTEAAIYRHFASKEELVSGLVDSLRLRLLGPISAIAADRSLSAPARLERMVRHHVGLLRSTGGLPILLMAEGLASGDRGLVDRLGGVMRTYLILLSGVLAELDLKAGVPAPLQAILFIGLPAALGMQMRALPDLAPSDEEIERLVHFYVEALTTAGRPVEEHSR